MDIIEKLLSIKKELKVGDRVHICNSNEACIRSKMKNRFISPFMKWNIEGIITSIHTWNDKEDDPGYIVSSSPFIYSEEWLDKI